MALRAWLNKGGAEGLGGHVPDAESWVGRAIDKMCWVRSHMVSLPTMVQEQEAEFTDLEWQKSHHGNYLLTLFHIKGLKRVCISNNSSVTNV